MLGLWRMSLGALALPGLLRAEQALREERPPLRTPDAGIKPGTASATREWSTNRSGLEERPTGVNPARVVKELLA